MGCIVNKNKELILHSFLIGTVPQGQISNNSCEF